MNAPRRFVEWLSTNEHRDQRYGHVYRYHSRSDAHSIALCTYILEDLLANCAILAQQAAGGEVAYGINLKHTWPAINKAKTLDLAIDLPDARRPNRLSRVPGIAEVAQLAEVLLACEAKSVMTEHGKSQPRVYDELNSSYEMVHRGRPDAIAAGVAVVNIGEVFYSPLRQTADSTLVPSRHRQPHAAQRMIEHLRGLPLRQNPHESGFDAYCTIVVSTDNRGSATLWEDPPAPQPDDPDSYESFISRISRFYSQRFSTLP